MINITGLLLKDPLLLIFRHLQLRAFYATPSGDSVKKKPSYIINPQTNNYAYWQLLTTCALGFAPLLHSWN